MGLGKRFKKAVGGIGQSVGNLTGSSSIGRATSMVVGAGLTGDITGSIGNAAYNQANREQVAMKNQQEALAQAQQIQADQQAQIAEQTRLRLLNEQDLKAQEEALAKKTTFAGASIQSINERRKLLGA